MADVSFCTTLRLLSCVLLSDLLAEYLHETTLLPHSLSPDRLFSM